MEAQRQTIISTGHQVEAFRRVGKNFKPLESYLEKPKEYTQREGSQALIKMFKRLQAKGAPVKVERVVRVPKKD